MKIWFTLAGAHHYHGSDFMEKGMRLFLEKEPDNQHDKEGQAHAGKRFLRGKCFLFHNDAPSWSDRNIDAVALLLCRCNQIPGLHGRPDDAHKENGRPV